MCVNFPWFSLQLEQSSDIIETAFTQTKKPSTESIGALNNGAKYKTWFNVGEEPYPPNQLQSAGYIGVRASLLTHRDLYADCVPSLQLNFLGIASADARAF